MKNTKINTDIIHNFLEKNYQLTNGKLTSFLDDRISANGVVINIVKVFSLPQEFCLRKTVSWLKSKGLKKYEIEDLFHKYNVEIISDKFNVSVSTDDIKLANINNEMINLGGMKVFTRASFTDVEIYIKRNDIDKKFLNYLLDANEFASTFAFKTIITNNDLEFKTRNIIEYSGCFLKSINTTFTDEDSYVIDLMISVSDIKIRV